MLATSPDVTIQKLQEELVQMQRQALLGSAAAMIAHEFNNLMTPVLARAEYAASSSDPIATQKAIAVTIAQTTRALDITRRILDLVDGAAIERANCVVAEAVKYALDATVRPLSKDAIAVTMDIPPELDVFAHPRLFEQVILNLLLLSRDAMKNRGGRLSIRAAGDASLAVIEVADTSQRFTRHYMEHVLTPFLNADASKDPCDWQAIGLGLNVARMIVQGHGGRMDAHNGGDECVFRMYWPRAPRTARIAEVVGLAASTQTAMTL
ncbi:MAG: sensor histidine kinase [Phycisphaerae bacterium]